MDNAEMHPKLATENNSALQSIMEKQNNMLSTDSRMPLGSIEANQKLTAEHKQAVRTRYLQVVRGQLREKLQQAGVHIQSTDDPVEACKQHGNKIFPAHVKHSWQTILEQLEPLSKLKESGAFPHPLFDTVCNIIMVGLDHTPARPGLQLPKVAQPILPTIQELQSYHHERSAFLDVTLRLEERFDTLAELYGIRTVNNGAPWHTVPLSERVKALSDNTQVRDNVVRFARMKPEQASDIMRALIYDLRTSWVHNIQAAPDNTSLAVLQHSAMILDSLVSCMEGNSRHNHLTTTTFNDTHYAQLAMAPREVFQIAVSAVATDPHSADSTKIASQTLEKFIYDRQLPIPNPESEELRIAIYYAQLMQKNLPALFCSALLPAANTPEGVMARAALAAMFDPSAKNSLYDEPPDDGPGKLALQLAAIFWTRR